MSQLESNVTSEKMLYSVHDSNVETMLNSVYDLAIFASGYEKRATYVPKKLERIKIASSLVLGFKELEHDKQRNVNDKYFSECWIKPSILSADDDHLIYEQLNKLNVDSRATVQLLIDYSSMSRIWYTSLLNWARYASNISSVIIDFVYTIGNHRKYIPPAVLTDILCIPGCEGVSRPSFNSVAVFGLGFDTFAPLCAIDLLEPNVIFSFLANPGAFEDYPKITRKKNQELIKNYSKYTLDLPLKSVETTFRYLSELISPYLNKADIYFVPTGPKPHVLASILVSLRCPEVGCLRIRSRRDRAEDVGTTGEIIVTRVVFKTSGN